jgi:hypothetical protein
MRKNDLMVKFELTDWRKRKSRESLKETKWKVKECFGSSMVLKSMNTRKTPCLSFEFIGSRNWREIDREHDARNSIMINGEKRYSRNLNKDFGIAKKIRKHG